MTERFISDAEAEAFCALVNWEPDGTQLRNNHDGMVEINFRDLAKGYIRAADQAGGQRGPIDKSMLHRLATQMGFRLETSTSELHDISQPAQVVEGADRLSASEAADGVLSAFEPRPEDIAAFSASLAEFNAPFDNCRFDICDLPGQCKSEGKCHHPKQDNGVAPSVAPDVTYERGRYTLTIYRAPSGQWSWSVKLDGEPVVSGAGYDIRDDAQKDGLEEFERHAPSPCPPTKITYIEVRSVAPLERTPMDYAIEHAEYMAVGGEMLLAAINEAHEVGERHDNEEATEEEVAIAVEVLSEKMKGLLKGIYEFRKRRDRVISLPAEKGTLSGKEQERLDRLERRAEHLRGRIAAAEFEKRDLAFDKMELSALLWVVRKIRALTVNV